MDFMGKSWELSWENMGTCPTLGLLIGGQQTFLLGLPCHFTVISARSYNWYPKGPKGLDLIPTPPLAPPSSDPGSRSEDLVVDPALTSNWN
jgi:hypothetical protein